VQSCSQYSVIQVPVQVGLPVLESQVPVPVPVLQFQVPVQVPVLESQVPVPVPVPMSQVQVQVPILRFQVPVPVQVPSTTTLVQCSIIARTPFGRTAYNSYVLTPTRLNCANIANSVGLIALKSDAHMPQANDLQGHSKSSEMAQIDGPYRIIVFPISDV